MTDILYISYDGLTDPLGQSQVLPYIIGLSNKGYCFILLTCEKKEAYHKNKRKICESIEGAKIKWEPVFYTKSPPVLSSVYDYWKLKLKAISLFKKHDFSLIHCRSYLPSMIGLWMQKKYNVRFLFDMRGFWADERVDGGLWQLNNVLYKQVYLYFKRKEKAFLESADHIVSLTHAGKAELDSWEHINKKSLPVSIIPCCVDTNLFDIRSIDNNVINDLREELGITNNENVITYLGSIGTWYMLDEMLSFFKVYLSLHKAAKFLFITRDATDSIYLKASEHDIPLDRIITVSADRNSVPLYASLGKFSLFFIKPAYSKKSSSPTKQAELMALGIPIICNSNVGDTDMIVNQYNSGLIVNDFNDEEYRNVASELENTSFNPTALRNGALDYFSLEQGVASYNDIYNLLTK